MFLTEMIQTNSGHDTGKATENNKPFLWLTPKFNKATITLSWKLIGI